MFVSFPITFMGLICALEFVFPLVVTVIGFLITASILVMHR